LVAAAEPDTEGVRFFGFDDVELCRGQFVGDFAAVVADVGEAAEDPWQRVVNLQIDGPRGLRAPRIVGGQFEQWTGEFLHRAIGLHVDVGLVIRFEAEKIQAHGLGERSRQQDRANNSGPMSTRGCHRRAEEAEPSP
ncbi:MAG: hypothetical protein ACK559_09715, partial [bacterium]